MREKCECPWICRVFHHTFAFDINAPKKIIETRLIMMRCVFARG